MVLVKRNKIISVFCFFPVCIKNQIIWINNQNREVISVLTSKHFLSLHLLSVTAGFNSSALAEKSCRPYLTNQRTESPHWAPFPFSDSSGIMEGKLFLPICTVALLCVCFHVNKFRYLEAYMVLCPWGRSMSWVWDTAACVLAEEPSSMQSVRWAGPSVSPSGRLSLLVLTLLCTLVHSGENRAALCLRCCCLRGWLVAGWIRVNLTWDRLGSTSWRISPILTGPL